jgi:Cu+-exporting ATPase
MKLTTFLSLLTIIVLFVSSPQLYGQVKSDTIKSSAEIIYYDCPMHPDVKSFTPGTCSKCGMNLEQRKANSVKAESQKDAVYYTCSMHPEIKETKSGKCPKCGMELIKKSSSDTPSKENKKMKHCMGGMDMK